MILRKRNIRRKQRRNRANPYSKDEKLLRITFIQSAVTVLLLGATVILGGFGVIDENISGGIYDVINGEYTNVEMVGLIFDEESYGGELLTEVINLYREPVNIQSEQITNLPPVPVPPENSRVASGLDETGENEVENMYDKDVDDEIPLDDDFDLEFDDAINQGLEDRIFSESIPVLLTGEFTSIPQMTINFPDEIVSDCVITSEFGFRNHPITGLREFHTGIDLAAEQGTEIMVAFDGEVTNIGVSQIYGNYLEVKHSPEMYTYYSHCEDTTVDVGDIVTAGEVIATVGSTGVSTGPHLHFEVMIGSAYINPAEIFTGGMLL